MPAARQIHYLNNFPNPALAASGTTIRPEARCTMQRVYDSLTEQYDLRLVFLAELICIATCLISANLFVRANEAGRNRPLPWLFVAATVFGAGVGATNFIAELAFEPGFPINYDAGLTAISFLAAIGAVWLGMLIVHRYAAPVEGGTVIGGASPRCTI
jgi:diguanylate cyclase